MLDLAVADADIISVEKEPKDEAHPFTFPRDELGRRGTALLVAETGDTPEDLRKFFEINPSSAMVFEVLDALAPLRSGGLIQAKDQFAKLLNREWISYTIRHLAALSHLLLWPKDKQTGDLEQAIGIYRRILDEYSHFFEAQLNLGVCYVHQNKWDLAEICFSNASKLHPKEASMRNNLGVLHEYKGDLARAETDFRWSMRFLKKSRENLRQMGFVLEEEAPGLDFREVVKKAHPDNYYLMHPAYDILKQCLDEANAVDLALGQVMEIGDSEIVRRQDDEHGSEQDRGVRTGR